MFLITKHENRSVEQGQYQIQFSDFVDMGDSTLTNSFSYFCDEAHLHMIRDEILRYCPLEHRTWRSP